MIRATIGLVVGLIVWGILAVALDMLLRAVLPGYAAAEPHLRFTLEMMVGRLALPGAIPSIAAGFASTWIAKGDRRVVAALVIILLALFLPAHYRLWSQFPVWYHLTFLGSLLLLPLLGAKLRSLAFKR